MVQIGLGAATEVEPLASGQQLSEVVLLLHFGDLVLNLEGVRPLGMT